VHKVNAFISINGLIDYLLHLEELNYFTNYVLLAFFQLLHFHCLSDNGTCILMLSVRRKNRTIVT